MNTCYRLRHPDKDDWPCGEPVGIEFDPVNANDKDKELALAYAFLKVPIKLPDSWAIPENYSLQEAQAALFSEGQGSATGRLTFSTILELPETDHDALVFSRVRPQCPEHRYNTDGSRLTKLQRKEHNDGESTDMAEDEGSEVGSAGDAPFPADKIVEITEDTIMTDDPSLQSRQAADETATQPLDDIFLELPILSAPGQTPLQLDTALGLRPPTSTSNPASASTSAPASAVSSASSFNDPSLPRSGAYPHRGCSSRRQQRSSAYPRTSRPSRSQAGRDAWEQYFEDQEARGVSYENAGSDRSRNASSSALARRSSTTELGSV